MPPATPYVPTHIDRFESQFANLNDSSVAAESLVAMAARIENKRAQLTPELSANKDVKAILDAGLPEVFDKGIGLNVIAKMTPSDFRPSNGINALLTPAVSLGNRLIVRHHAVSGEAFIFPANIPHRMFIKPYDDVPQISEVSPEETEGLDKFIRIKVSGKRKGQVVEDELVLPA